MSNKVDQVSSIIRRVTDILLVEDYFGTSLAVVVGSVAYGIARIIAAAIPETATILNAVGAWFYVVLSVAVFGLRAYRARKPLPAKAATALAAIRDARRNGLISNEQSYEMTERLINNLIEDAIIRGELSRQRQRRNVEPDSAEPVV